jgi:hypothetical protein
VRYAPVSFAQMRIKKPIIIPGEKMMLIWGSIELRPVFENAAKGNIENGIAV